MTKRVAWASGSVVMVLGLAACTIGTVGGEGVSADELFLFESAAGLTAPPSVHHARDLVPVQVNRAALFNERGTVFRLFDDTPYVAVREELRRRTEDEYVWLGSVQGRPDSAVTLVIRGEVTVGSIHIGPDLYELRYQTGGIHWLSWVDVAALPEDPAADALAADEPLAPPPAGDATTSAPDDGSVLDVLVAYTPQAKTAQGGTAAIEALATLGIELGNQALANSDIGAQFRLVGTTEISYQETGDMNATLTRLRTPADGYMDAVQGLRDELGADLVVLLTSESAYCGIAYVMMTESSSFAPYAYSVTSTACVTNHTMAHEIGHNLGSAHDRASGGAGVTPYSHGFRYCSDTVKGFRTVMAYPCGAIPRVPFFSNPRVYHNGLPTGVDYALDPANSADNARSIQSVLDTVANFRLSDGGGPPPVGCGNGLCDGTESRCSCASDCGAPPAVESSCADGTDEDCDGLTDCSDGDCSAASACVPVTGCGNGTCETGEGRCNCAGDCGAPPAVESSCADGTDEDCDGLTDCSDGDCSAASACAPVTGCGNRVCEASENRCGCPADCGTPPSSENLCANGADDDCDGRVDCGDGDCASSSSCAPPPTCAARGASCTTGASCCSGKCGGKPGKRTCR